MRWICLLTGFLLLTLLPAQAGHKPPQVMLRVFVQTAGEGLPPEDATTIKIPPDGETIQIRTLPEATEAELVDVRQDASGGIRLVFNHQGKVALNAVTSQNEGRILVVMMDGYVIYAPTIDEQINNGELDIPHTLTPAAVQLLQETARRNVTQASHT